LIAGGAALVAAAALGRGGGGPLAPVNPIGTLLSPCEESLSAAIVKVHSAPSWVQLVGAAASQIPAAR
jgi:hypothetical protein